MVQMNDKNEINANECSIKLFEEDNTQKLIDYNLELTSDTAVETVNDSNKQSHLSMEETLDNNINLVVDEPVDINQSNQNEEFSTVRNSATTTFIFDSVSFDFDSMRKFITVSEFIHTLDFIFYHFQILK